MVLLVGLITMISALGLLFNAGFNFSVDSLIYAALLVIGGMVVTWVIKMHHSVKEYNVIADENQEEAA